MLNKFKTTEQRKNKACHKKLIEAKCPNPTHAINVTEKTKWKTVIDFTKFQENGISAREVLSKLELL